MSEEPYTITQLPKGVISIKGPGVGMVDAWMVGLPICNEHDEWWVPVHPPGNAPLIHVYGEDATDALGRAVRFSLFPLYEAALREIADGEADCDAATMNEMYNAIRRRARAALGEEVK